jgi:AraC-like DNA-binding protein
LFEHQKKRKLKIETPGGIPLGRSGETMKRIFSPFMRTYIFFFVCLLIILIPVCLYTYRLSRDISISEGRRHLLTQGEILRNDLNRMSALIQNIGTYETVIQASMYRTPLNPIERYALERARKMLANAMTAQSGGLIAEYGIVFQNGGCITANRIFDTDTDCFGRFIRYRGDAENQWRSLAGLSSPGLYYTPEQGDFSGIVYAGNMPIRFVSSQSARVFFIINTELLLARLMNHDMASIEFRGTDGSFLAVRGEPVETAGRYLISHHDPAGFSISAAIPRSTIWRKMRGDLVFIGISMGLFFLTGLGLSVYLSYRNSKPLIDGLFDRILNGLPFTPREWEGIAGLFRAIPPVYCLCLIRGNDSVTFNRSSVYSAVQDMIGFLTEHADFPKQMDFAGFIHYIGADQAVVLLPVYEAFAEPEAYQGILERGMETLGALSRVRLHAALSGVFRGLERLPDAYRQVRQILRVVTIHTPSAVFLERNADKSLDHYPLEFTDSQRFYELLLAADFEHADLMVRRAFAAINGAYPAEPLIYHLFWSFEQVFIRIKAEHILGEDQDFTVPEYLETDTLEQMAQKIADGAGQICAGIDRSHKQKETSLAAALTAYIDQNLSNPMLCLAGAAAAFGISEAATGSLVKKSAGKTFFEYVDQKRMKKAYALLAESNIPVNDIASKCGFALVNSFYKSFKRHFGFPPTALRRAAKGP